MTKNEILKTLTSFKQDMKDILGNNLFEVIIYGSFSLNDFIPGRGDLDFILLTHEEIKPAKTDLIFCKFAEYRTQDIPLKKQLEGTFYPKRKLANINSGEKGIYIGTSPKGWRTTESFENSFIDLVAIKQAGIFLNQKETDVYSPSSHELKAERKRSYQSLKSLSETEDYVVFVPLAGQINLLFRQWFSRIKKRSM